LKNSPSNPPEKTATYNPLVRATVH
jgi:hypothetical protein